MSTVADVKYQLSLMRRNPGESDESFATRLFNMQIEVYSANAGRDLQTKNGFWDLDKAEREPWIDFARNHAEANGY